MQNVDIISEFPNKKQEKKVSYLLFLYSQCRNISGQMRRRLPSLCKVHIPTSADGHEEEQGGGPAHQHPRVTVTQDNTLQNLEVWEECGKAEDQDVY